MLKGAIRAMIEAAGPATSPMAMQQLREELEARRRERAMRTWAPVFAESKAALEDPRTWKDPDAVLQYRARLRFAQRNLGMAEVDVPSPQDKTFARMMAQHQSLVNQALLDPEMAWVEVEDVLGEGWLTEKILGMYNMRRLREATQAGGPVGPGAPSATPTPGAAGTTPAAAVPGQEALSAIPTARQFYVEGLSRYRPSRQRIEEELDDNLKRYGDAWADPNASEDGLASMKEAGIAYVNRFIADPERRASYAAAWGAEESRGKAKRKQLATDPTRTEEYQRFMQATFGEAGFAVDMTTGQVRAKYPFEMVTPAAQLAAATWLSSFTGKPYPLQGAKAAIAEQQREIPEQVWDALLAAETAEDRNRIAAVSGIDPAKQELIAQNFALAFFNKAYGPGPYTSPVLTEARLIVRAGAGRVGVTEALRTATSNWTARETDKDRDARLKLAEAAAERLVRRELTEEDARTARQQMFTALFPMLDEAVAEGLAVSTGQEAIRYLTQLGILTPKESQSSEWIAKWLLLTVVGDRERDPKKIAQAAKDLKPVAEGIRADLYPNEQAGAGAGGPPPARGRGWGKDFTVLESELNKVEKGLGTRWAGLFRSMRAQKNPDGTPKWSDVALIDLGRHNVDQRVSGWFVRTYGTAPAAGRGPLPPAGSWEDVAAGVFGGGP